MQQIAMCVAVGKPLLGISMNKSVIEKDKVRENRRTRLGVPGRKAKETTTKYENGISKRRTKNT